MRQLLLCFVLLSGPLVAADTVWVSRQFTGGPLCSKAGPEANFIAPGFESTAVSLTRKQIKIYRRYFSDEVPCQVCGKCPNYRREIYFEIETSMLSVAASAGFTKPAAAPSEDDVLKFERMKLYHAPPDLPPED